MLYFVKNRWHLGHCKEEYLPNQRGFDSFYGYWSGAIVGHILKYIKLQRGRGCTGWSISILHILTCWYDNNNVHTKEIMVDLFSVYPDISFDNKKSEKITGISFHNRNNRIIIDYKNKL